MLRSRSLSEEGDVGTPEGGGEVIEFPKDKPAVASNTPKLPERDEGNPFAALGWMFLTDSG
jgi:hypothetical protein